MKRFGLVDEARDELLRETAYYESKRAGTGRRFRQAVLQACELIQSFPGAGAPGPADTRKTKVRGFPFTVAYRETQDLIVVFAISPDRRQPGYWLPRAHAER